MAGRCCLSPDLDEVLEHGRACDAYLRHDHAASAEPYIVSNLDQIIDPRAGTDHRVARRTSVYRGIGADFHIGHGH